MRPVASTLIALLALTLCLAGDAQVEDPLYARVLSAYRGALTSEQVEQLAEQDPAPALYLGPKTPGEWGIARLFASLPDSAHAELRRTGYLKWSVASLPQQQRAWLVERVRQLERRGEGPFPLEGKEPASTGFARVQVEGLESPQYAWWIAHPKAKRTGWLTLVRALRTLTQEYSEAYRERLQELEALPETPAVPRGAWQRVKDPILPKAPEEEKPLALMDEKLYHRAARGYRGALNRDERALLAASDPLIDRRLRLTEEADKALNRLFGTLKDREHETLLTTGRLLLRPHEFSKERRKLLEVIVGRLNAEGRSGGLGELYDLIPYGRTRIGFAILTIPEVEKPVLSWWISSPLSVAPSWVTLINGDALKAPLYFRTHVEQLRSE